MRLYLKKYINKGGDGVGSLKKRATWNMRCTLSKVKLQARAMARVSPLWDHRWPSDRQRPWSDAWDSDATPENATTLPACQQTLLNAHKRQDYAKHWEYLLLVVN